MADAFDIARIAKTEALILVYEDALLALGEGNMESYTLDTGQSRQTVTKLNLTSLNKTLDSLLNRRATLRARCYGEGVINVRPAW